MDDTPQEGFIANVAKATRQQLMDSYRALLKKYKDTTAAPVQDTANAQVLTLASKYGSSADIGQSVAATRQTVQTTLTDLEQKLNEKFAELKSFSEAIVAEQTKLKELYEIEESAGSLMVLLGAMEETKRQANLEKELLEQKRKREEEEYKFNLDLQKRKDREAFEAEKRAMEVELHTREAAFTEKQKFQEAREAEFENFKQQVAEFPAKFEQEKQRLEQELLETARRDKEVALLLLQKEMESQKTVLDGRVIALESIIDEQKRMISSLQDQLKVSQTQTQEVVLKSIDSASGAKTLDAVNKLAMEQSRANSGSRQN